jgi:hypothetical protein
MQRKTTIAAALSAWLSGAAHAHHGVAGYDMRDVRELTGTVVRWDWRSPHTWLTLRSTDGGAQLTWEIEGAPPQWMSGQGWTPESLRAGETVTITYHPSRQLANGGILMEVERADGAVLKVNRPARLGGP